MRVLVVVCLAVLSVAFAEDSTENLMASIDKDNNGKIDAKELATTLGVSQALAKEIMREVSANGDSLIDVDEVSSYLKRKGAGNVIKGLSLMMRLKNVDDHLLLDENQWRTHQSALLRARRYNQMMQPGPALLEQYQTSLQKALMKKASSEEGSAGSSLAESPVNSDTDASQTTVTACGTGKWSDTGSTPCAPCASCGSDEVLLIQCSANANTQCKKCEDGNCCDIKTRAFWADGTSCGRIVGAPAFMDAGAKTELTVNGVCQSGTCILTASQNN